MTKKLQRSNDRVLGGVCAGFAEYMDYAALTLFTAFAGIPFYIVAWIIIPEKNALTQQ